MPRPLSIDVRNRIIDSWQKTDLTWRQIAARHGVSLATVNRVIRRYRQTGSAAPRPHAGGRRRLIGKDGLEVLRRLVEEAPGRTLVELTELYAEKTGVRTSITTMHRAVHRISRRRHLPASA